MLVSVKILVIIEVYIIIRLSRKIILKFNKRQIDTICKWK